LDASEKIQAIGEELKKINATAFLSSKSDEIACKLLFASLLGQFILSNVLLLICIVNYLFPQGF